MTAESHPPEIKILADPSSDTRSCVFRVDRPVSELVYFFDSSESARGSPLAEGIFGLGDVASVQVVHDRVTVTLSRPSLRDWRPLAVQIGGLIRSTLQSGRPALDPELSRKLPPEDEIRRTVQEILDQQINPAVQSHGGQIELLDVQKNVVYIRMHGGCQGCASSQLTLKLGVEQSVRQRIPQVGAVLDSTDHASGTNPYYAPAH